MMLWESVEAGDTKSVCEILDSNHEENNNSVPSLDDSGNEDQKARCVEERGPQGETCVTVACAKGYYNIVKILVDHGADINDNVNKTGDSPLHKAVESGFYNIAVYLLNHSCKTHLVNLDNLTALQLAQSTGRGAIAVAIQITNRNRTDMERRKEKKRLINEEKQRLTEERNKEAEIIIKKDDVKNLDSTALLSMKKATILNLKKNIDMSLINLTGAKNLVHNLEQQVMSAKHLVRSLEIEVENTRASLQQLESGDTLLQEEQFRCPVCLEQPHGQVFQCPEGHVFCGECKDRPEMVKCPECRISLEGVSIRNRILEGIIQQGTAKS